MYASKSLNEMERKYQVYEQECLAVVWAAELFRKYIRNNKTIVLTDCAALQWLKSRKIGARVSRWILRLQEFDLDIRHRKGVDSTDVDGLTREPALARIHTEKIKLNGFTASCRRRSKIKLRQSKHQASGYWWPTRR